MIVFVTGATGFIGQHLVRRLVQDGHQVRCLVRSQSKSTLLKDLGVQLVTGDVNDQEVLRRGMDGCDWLFHLANLYSMWEPDPSLFYRINVEGTCAVLDAAIVARIKKIVYVSTVAVFGRPAGAPFDETCSPGPELFSEYARTKAAADRLAWDRYHRQGMPLVVLYPGIVLGAGDDKASGHYIQDLIHRRVPSTIFHHSLATYVYVGDVVDALIRAAEKPESVGQRYLLGRYTLDGRAYAALIRDLSGVPLPVFRFPDWMVMAAAHLLTGLSKLTHRPPWWGLSVDAGQTLRNGFWFDGSKAVRELGIRYTPVEKALAEAIESYQSPQPWWMNPPGAH